MTADELRQEARARAFELIELFADLEAAEREEEGQRRDATVRAGSALRSLWEHLKPPEAEREAAEAERERQITSFQSFLVRMHSASGLALPGWLQGYLG